MSGCSTMQNLAALEPTPVYMDVCPAHRGQREDLRSNKAVRKATGGEYISIFAKLTGSAGDDGLKLFHALSVESDEALKDLKNRTRLRYDKHHGNQLSYSAPDGRIFLAYPDNSRVLRGRWLVCTATYGLLNKTRERVYFPYAKVCFRYNTTARNAATGVRGIDWECGPAGLLRKSITDSREGDVFKLETMRGMKVVLSTTAKQTFGTIPTCSNCR